MVGAVNNIRVKEGNNVNVARSGQVIATNAEELSHFTVGFCDSF